MRIIVKQAGNLVKELHFDKGPIYIGRQMGNQIQLPHVSISRQHAVIFGPNEGKWFIEDLESANKTYINDKAIHKSEVKEGDVLRISDFYIDLVFNEDSADKLPLGMADTIASDVHAPDTIIRRFEADDAPDIRMPPQRAKDFSKSTLSICNTKSPEELLSVLLDIATEQFDTFHTWVGLRTETTGEMTLTVGKKNTGQTVNLSELMFQKMIAESLEKKEYILIPQVPSHKHYERIRSAIIAPIICQGECYGVIYADNAVKQRHYSLTDLDYLMLLCVQAGVILQNL